MDVEAESSALAAAAVAAAVRTPRDLAALAATAAETRAQLAAAEASLEGAVRRTLGEMHTGLALLGSGVRGVGEEDATLASLGAAAADCAAFLGEGHALSSDGPTRLASLLAHARANLRACVAAAEDVLSVPEQADAVAASIAGKEDMTEAYELVEMLSRRAEAVQVALGLGGGGAERSDDEADEEVLADFFARADAVRTDFEAELFARVRAFLHGSVRDPARLVNALQTVELHDAVRREECRERGAKQAGSRATASAVPAASVAPSEVLDAVATPEPPRATGGAAGGAAAGRAGVTFAHGATIDVGGRADRSPSERTPDGARLRGEGSGSLRDVPIVDLSALLGRGDAGGGAAEVTEVRVEPALSERVAAGDANAGAVGGAGASAQAASCDDESYRARALEAMREGVHEHWMSVFEALGEDGGRLKLREVLELADERVAELVDVYDVVSPCFPPSFDAFEAVADMYNGEVTALLRACSERARDELGNGDLIDLLEWVHSYGDSLVPLGLDGDGVRRPTDANGLAGVVSEYARRLRAAVANWFRNMVTADFADGGQAAVHVDPSTGRCSTPFPVDVFRVVDEQMALARRARCPDITHAVAQALVDELGKLTLQARASLDRAATSPVSPGGVDPYGRGVGTSADAASAGRPALALEFMAAQANNAFKCHDLTADWLESLDSELPPPWRDEVAAQGEGVCRGFAEMGAAAARLVAREVYTDPGLDVAIRSFCSVGEAWLSGEVVRTVVATLEDYAGDLKAHLDSAPFRRLMPRVFESLAARYVMAVATAYPQDLHSEGARALERDANELKSLFTLYLDERRAEETIAPVEVLQALAEADGAEDFIIEYTTAVRVHPDFLPAFIERVLTANQRIKKRFKAETLAECRRIHDQQGGLSPTDAQGNPASVLGRAAAMMQLGQPAALTNLTALAAAKLLPSKGRTR